jgi:hypothetical protein
VKLHLFFLAIYMIMLPLLPCGDAQECEEKETLALQSSLEHEEHDESETCTPFCYCACCSVSANNTVLPQPETPFEFFYPEFFTSRVQLPAIALHAIWQPPRNC